MRTTLDLPDTVFRQLKARAALEGLSLKDLLARYVTNGLQASVAQADQVSDGGPPATARFVSAHEAMKKGCGIARSGHHDLSTNPKHMEGFGRD